MEVKCIASTPDNPIESKMGYATLLSKGLTVQLHELEFIHAHKNALKHSMGGYYRGGWSALKHSNLVYNGGGEVTLQRTQRGGIIRGP